MATRTEKGRIVQPGMGGFLNPPTHPEHDWHVETDLRRRPENRGGMSLTAATEATWLDSATRAEARKMLKNWQPPPLNSPEIVDWRQQVLGYFRGMYRNPNEPKDEQWNASTMIHDPNRDPIANADEHAGVHLIRKYYPGYVPTEEDFGGAYWGSKPKHATAHEAPSRQVAAHRDPVDEHAATELVMYIENESDLSPDGPSGQGRSVLVNMLRKWKKGTYDPTLAVRQFEYLAEAGAKQYAKEFGEPKDWSTMFNPATRHEAAKQLEASFRNSAENGEYDHVDTRIGHHSREVEARRRPKAPERSMTYPSSTSGQYVLTRDGQEIMRGTEEEIWRWIHRNHSYSIDHALRYEGYAIAPVENVSAREVHAERKFSMSYGELPSFEEFEQDIRRPDPDKHDHPYWPEYTRFPMELVSSREIELAERYGLPEFRAERHRTGRNSRVRGFNADEREMYGFLEYLVEQLNDGDDEAGDLASSIMTTLGYEWI